MIDWFFRNIEERWDIATFLNRHLTRNFVVNTRVFSGVIGKQGEMYSIHPNVCTVGEVYTQYRFDDIREGDLVLDIGANVGAFSLLASRMAKQVDAYEPVMTKELVRNVLLNRIDNIRVYNDALGTGETSTVQWEGVEHTVPTKTLTQMKSHLGGCDFLKCDCEGAEWGIRPGELSDIRRIEIEFHTNRGYNADLIAGITDIFDCEWHVDGDTRWVHGVNKNVK
jgi:FkbM family methyltransferase